MVPVRRGGEGSFVSTMHMKGRILACSVILALGCAMLVSASPCAFAQRASSSKHIVIGGEDEGGKNEVAFLGVQIDDLTKRIIDKFDYPRETGVIIIKVEEGSAAEKAGLEANDIVYLFGGTKLKEAYRLTELVRERNPGDKVTLVIYRNGQEKKVPVVLGKRSELSIVAEDFGRISEDMSAKLRKLKKATARMYSNDLVPKRRLGMEIDDLNGDLAEYFSVKKGEGVLVLDVEAESPAGRAGIRGGDVITRIGGNAVAGSEDFMDALSNAEEGDTVAVVVLRKGATRTFKLEMEDSSETYLFQVAPFDRSGEEGRALEKYFKASPGEEAAKLKEEMRTLKERLRELEERLGEMERQK